MRDRVLAYAFAISLIVHVVVFCVAGRTSASRSVDAEMPKLVHVEMLDLQESPPPPPPVIEAPTPVEPVLVPPPVKVSQPSPVVRDQDRPRHTERVTPSAPSPVVRSEPTPRSEPRIESTRPAGNPGGPLDLGGGSKNGVDVGPSGRTRVGRVPGSPGGQGTGPGRGPGTAPAEPVKGAADGPGHAPAPPPPPPPLPPPPPKDVEVRVCAESGLLPGENCERTGVRSYRPGNQPSTKCSVCKPKHVSTLADRSVPEFVSGRQKPVYPASAKQRGIEGAVTVEYTINTEGNVVGVKVSSSSGNSELDRAAIECVESRKYKPAVQAGIPRNYRKRETFRFSLD